MDSAVNAEMVNLLSDLSGQTLAPSDITPTIMFLSALVAVLSGVMVMDGVVRPEEEERLQTILNSFEPPDTPTNHLIQHMLDGIEHSQAYLKPDDLLILATPLSRSQKLMLVGLGYEMAAADGSVDVREKMYLQSIAHRFELPPQHVEVLEIGFTREGNQDHAVLKEVAAMLTPSLFRSLDPVFIDVARSLLIALPTTSEETQIIEADSSLFTSDSSVE